MKAEDLADPESLDGVPPVPESATTPRRIWWIMILGLLILYIAFAVTVVGGSAAPGSWKIPVLLAFSGVSVFLYGFRPQGPKNPDSMPR
jgi:predicted phage tail protein